MSAVRCGSVDSLKVLVKNPTTVSLLNNKRRVSVSTSVLYCLRQDIPSNFAFSGQSALHLCAILKNDKLLPYSSAMGMCEALLEKEVHRLPERDFASYVDLQDTGGNTGTCYTWGYEMWLLS